MKKSVNSVENITCVIKRGSGDTLIVKGKNIVTNDGDIAYAQKVVGEATNFDNPYLRLGTGTTAVDKTDTDVTTFITGSDKAVDTGFPQRNNTDPGNTDGGVNIVTWKISYALGDLDVTGIAEGAITNVGTNPSYALNHFLFASSFDVTSSDQLTIYCNHKLEGI